MNYVGTAFTQLAFAWKLYEHALEGKIDLNELDRPLTFQGGGMVLVLPDKVSRPRYRRRRQASTEAC